MLKNYFKTAFRQLYKNKLFTLINIVGLSVAVASCVVAYLNFDFAAKFDGFHENAQSIYRVNSLKVVKHERQHWGIVPLPLARRLEADFPEIKAVARLTGRSGAFKSGDKVFNENLHFTDPEFMSMFTFPIKFGSKDALLDKKNVVLSEEMAVKYFGDEDPVGRQIQLIFNDEVYEFFVGAVTHSAPLNSSLPFGFLVPYANLTELEKWDLTKWTFWSHACFVQLKPHTSPDYLEQQLAGYVEIANKNNLDWEISGLYLQPLSEMGARARDLRSNILMPSLHPAALWGPTITAIFILLLSCFNFVNTSIAFSARRIKEIGLRKVVGSLRHQLVTQFMSENLILCLLAIGVGLVLAEAFVPAYSSLWPELELSINYSDNAQFLLFLGGLLVFTAFAAGIYPALYVSSFEPVAILKGRVAIGGTNPLIRILLVFQFSTAMIAIIIAIYFNQNATFQKEFDMGFEKDNLVFMQVNGEEDHHLLRDAIATSPNIKSIAPSRHVLGRNYSRMNVESEGTKSEIHTYDVTVEYIETLGIDLTLGRLFNSEIEGEPENAVVVNEELVEEFNWSEPLGQNLVLDSTRYTVIGVIKNFHQDGLWRKVAPCLMRIGEPEGYRYFTLKYADMPPNEMMGFLETKWKSVFPYAPFDARHQDVILAQSLMVTESIVTTFSHISILTILIASLGLFALVSLNIAKRVKEFGIRKVLGASVAQISYLVQREFLILLVIAALSSSFLGYYLATVFLDSIYAYHVDFNLTPYVASAGIVFLVAIITVGWQVLRVAVANPVDALRDE